MLALNGVAALTIQNRENVEEEQVDQDPAEDSILSQFIVVHHRIISHPYGAYSYIGGGVTLAILVALFCCCFCTDSIEPSGGYYDNREEETVAIMNVQEDVYIGEDDNGDIVEEVIDVEEDYVEEQY